MNTFLRFFYEFISVFFEGFIKIFKGLADGVLQMFDYGSYKEIMNSYKTSFGGAEWLFVGLTILILLVIVGAIILLIFFAVKRIVTFKKQKLNQEELLDEIGKLNDQVRTLMKEKQDIMAMKVSQLGLNPEDEAEETESTEQGEEEEEDTSLSRFPKLVRIDEKFKGFKPKNYNNTFTLSELIDNLRCYAASQLRLYYNESLLRAFIAGLACGKLIILQGISGTGKTSLAYAWGKFVRKDSCIASVQPSWKDKTELLGYFNEFTKKFTETNVLEELYASNYDDDIHTIILDEMNIARVEYYFAEMLSILEIPARDEWIVELVTTTWPDDPKGLQNGKLQLPDNMWYIGTINNDDSTFMVTDKVYDRAMPIDINEKIDPFKCREQESMNINFSYLESLFEEAIQTHKISKKSLDDVAKLDDYVIKHFRIAFGNRIMKQLNTFAAVYVACGGEEVEAIDYFLAKKVLRKFEQLNIALIIDEIDDFIKYLNKEFGEGKMKECIASLVLLKKSV